MHISPTGNASIKQEPDLGSTSRASALAALKSRRQQATGTLPAEPTTSTSSPVPSHDTPVQLTQQMPSGQQTASLGAAGAAVQGLKSTRTWAWVCNSCAVECVPIRTESRCLCGHRLKEHGKLAQTGPVSHDSKCGSARCSCSHFFYVVAEGSWVLHCRCKHKHTDHDPNTRKCKKPGCKGCDGFFSPWVCNCDHPWSDHVQTVVERQFKSVEQLLAEACVAEDINRHDLIQRGLDVERQL